MIEKLDAMLRPARVQELLGVGKTTLWRMVTRGEIERPVQVSRNVVAWRESYIAEFIRTRESKAA